MLTFAVLFDELRWAAALGRGRNASVRAVPWLLWPLRRSPVPRRAVSTQPDSDASDWFLMGFHASAAQKNANTWMVDELQFALDVYSTFNEYKARLRFEYSVHEAGDGLLVLAARLHLQSNRCALLLGV